MNYAVNIVLVFFVYSIIGWCIEVSLKYRQFGRFINRGFLAGPWLPIYGAGGALITISVNGIAPLESSFGTTFTISFIVCGIVEYMTSYIMEKRFHARWWDYSQKPMNLNGRVWIGNLILFGLGGVVIIHFTNPFVYMLFDMITVYVRLAIASLLLCIFIADYVMSHFVLKLVKIGVESSEADNTEEIRRDIQLLLSDKSIFYRRFADAYPDVIYRTEKVKARMEQIRSETEKMRAEAEQKIDQLNKQWEESKSQWISNMESNRAQFSANLEAGKSQIIEFMEPKSAICNNIIKKQNQLIEILYDESVASLNARVLKEEIDYEMNRLEKR